MTRLVVQQILKVRDTGEANMFDVNAVLQIAMREELYDLADYLLEHKTEYARFIMTGDTQDNDE